MISTNLDIKPTVHSSSSCGMTIKSKCVSGTHGQKLFGAIAGNDLPERAEVKVDANGVTIGSDLIASIDANVKSRCLKIFWKNKQLESSLEHVISSCLQFIRSARDKHEQNLELVQKENVFYVRTLRSIRQGEQLLIWYEDGYARELGVPILSLSNIRGHQNYMCTACGVTFTHPNILKAHMFLQCNSQASLPTPAAQSLVPFHQLLQTISKKPVPIEPSDSRKSTKSCEMSPLSYHYWGHSDLEQDMPYRSAFRTYPSSSSSSSRGDKGREDVLMTPDSSTDQSSALNLSIKQMGRQKSLGESGNGMQPWTLLEAQHMIPPVAHMDYSTLAGCYPLTPHFRSLDVKILNGDAALHTSHSYQTLMEARSGGRVDYPLSSSRMDHFPECASNPNPSSLSPSVRNFRNSNPYGFTLPSDKEPLDMLPQAYFANKSKKGHLCLCCGKIYSRKYGLKIHMRTHNGYKPLKCKICSRPFGDPSNLNKHVRLHAQGETPYRCEFCGKVLVRRRDLERHVRSRHPMGCEDTDEVLCESSPDSSLISVSEECHNDLHIAKQSSLNDSASN